MTEDAKIHIKGVGDGLLVTLTDLSWPESRNLVFSRIDEKSGFFQGAKLALDVGTLNLRAADLGKFRDELSSRGITLWAILSQSNVTQKTAQVLGLSTQLAVRQDHEKQKSSSTFIEGDPSIWIERTLRAGFKVETKNNVIVLGDVNPGAEIVSGGNILVWGKLAGAVHAGAEGKQEARVYALSMEPTSLRIASLVSKPLVKKKKKIPEFAAIEEKDIIVEAWEAQLFH